MLFQDRDQAHRLVKSLQQDGSRERDCRQAQAQAAVGQRR
jgi:hypothetical protein